MSQLRSICKRKDYGDGVQVMPDWRETMDRELLIPVSEQSEQQPAEQTRRKTMNDFSTEIIDRWQDQVNPEEIYNDADPLHFANLSNTIVPNMHRTPKVIFGDVHAGGDISNESGKIIVDERWGIEGADDSDLNTAAGIYLFQIFKYYASFGSMPPLEVILDHFTKNIPIRVLKLTGLNLYPVDNISFTTKLILQTEYNIYRYEYYAENPDLAKIPVPPQKRLALQFYAKSGTVRYNPGHLPLLRKLLCAFKMVLKSYLGLDNEQGDLRAATSRFACYLLEIFQKIEVLATDNPIQLAKSAILAWSQKRTMLQFETHDIHTLTEAVLREVEVIIQHYAINEAMTRQNRQDWIQPIFVPGRAVEDKFLQYTQKNLNTWLYIHTTLRALYSQYSTRPLVY